jgi:hypothetical protein
MTPVARIREPSQSRAFDEAWPREGRTPERRGPLKNIHACSRTLQRIHMAWAASPVRPANQRSCLA